MSKDLALNLFSAFYDSIVWCDDTYCIFSKKKLKKTASAALIIILSQLLYLLKCKDFFCWILKNIDCGNATFNLYNIKSTSKKAGAVQRAVANMAIQRKENLYSSIIVNHHFVTFSVETMGCFSESTKLFVNQLGKILNSTSGDNKSKSYFVQRKSLAIQRGNVASIIGTIPCSEKMDQIFYLSWINNLIVIIISIVK